MKIIDALCNELWDEEGVANLREAGLSAMGTTVSPADNFASAMKALAVWQSRLDRYPDRMFKVLKAGDIRRADDTGACGIILGFQEPTAIEDDLWRYTHEVERMKVAVESLDALYAFGTRWLQLTGNERNLFGDGCTERVDAGLSNFGITVVEHMDEIGMVVDVSHSGEKTTLGAIAASRKPVAINHSMCRALSDHPRSKSDETMKAMAEKGGVFGVLVLGYFLTAGPEQSTIEDYLDHVDHAVKVAGIDHVGVASDSKLRGTGVTADEESWMGLRRRVLPPSWRPRWPPWNLDLDRPDRYRVIAQGLETRGYTTGQIEKIMGENWMRFFKDVIG